MGIQTWGRRIEGGGAKGGEIRRAATQVSQIVFFMEGFIVQYIGVIHESCTVHLSYLVNDTIYIESLNIYMETTYWEEMVQYKSISSM